MDILQFSYKVKRTFITYIKITFVANVKITSQQKILNGVLNYGQAVFEPWYATMKPLNQPILCAKKILYVCHCILLICKKTLKLKFFKSTVCHLGYYEHDNLWNIPKL